MTSINSYYMQQAGSGLAGFRGVRYQKGYGFFGRLLSGAVYPMLRFIGKNILKTGQNFAQDVFQSQNFSPENIKESAKKHLRNSAADILDTAAKRMRGSGKVRKSKRNYKRKSMKIKKASRRSNRLKNKTQKTNKTIKARKRVVKRNSKLF